MEEDIYTFQEKEKLEAGGVLFSSSSLSFLPAGLAG